jgi:hypothetical protein
MVAKQVFGGHLIVVGGPTARIFREIGRLGVREIGSAGEDVVVDGREIVIGCEHVVEIAAVIVSIAAILIVSVLVVIRLLIVIALIVIAVAALIVVLIVLALIIGAFIIVTAAVVSSSIVAKVWEAATVAEIVTHKTSNDGCFPEMRLSTRRSKTCVMLAQAFAP